MTPAERWTLIIFLLIVLGGFAAEVFTDYQPVKLAGLLVCLFWIPLLALHEAGHALMAAALGWRVGRVVIGWGKLAKAFRVGNARVEVRLLPLEGFVQTVPGNLRYPQLKEALIYAAGPGIELLVFAIIGMGVGFDRLFTISDSYGMIALQSLAIAALAGAVLNLIPHPCETESGWVPNDGLGIVRSFYRTEAHYAAMMGTTFDEPEDWAEEDPDSWKRR
jgi:hypothetical protein